MFSIKLKSFAFSVPLLLSLWFFNLYDLLSICIYIFEYVLTIESSIKYFYYSNIAGNNVLDIYDYIIVGAGTSGCLIASELSSKSKATILLLEAGSYPSYFQIIPALSPLFHRTIYDWKYSVESQFHACGAMNQNQCFIPTGKGLGGSSMLNNMIWHRGDESDYKYWFENASEYDFYRDIQPLFSSLETKLKPQPLKHNTFLKTLSNQEVGGIKFIQPMVLQKFGKRFTTYDFLNTVTTNNLQIIPHANVIKINFNATETSFKVNGVNVEINQQTFNISIRKALIISAGAIGTPKLLLQSGVGPCNEIKQLGINCLKNVPGVGKNFQDHVATGMSLFHLVNESLEMDILNLLKPYNLLQYFNPLNRHGPLSTVGCELLGFTKDNKIGYMFMQADLTSDNGLKLKNVMNIRDDIWNLYFKKLLDKNTISILPILLHPKSKGSLHLKKSNGKFEVIINPNYLNDEEDIQNLLKGLEIVRHAIEDIYKKFKINIKLNDQLFPGCENFVGVNYWQCYLKAMSFGIYHPIGTCKMGSKNDSMAVVDFDFKLQQLDNDLYIVDASVMPNLPSGNPNAAVALLTQKFLKNFVMKLI